MSRKKSHQISNEEIVTVYELVERPDGTIGIGNSIEVTKSEAILLIQQGRAKHESAPRGEMPSSWQFGFDVEVEDGSSNN